MLKQDKVSGRYAKAIFDHLGDESKVRTMIQQLNQWLHAIMEVGELERALHSPTHTLEARVKVVTGVGQKLGLSNDCLKFLSILMEAQRMRQVARIIEKLKGLLLESLNIVPLYVETAVDLSKVEQTKLEAKFKEILGKGVEASYVLDPSLIGGVRVTAAGRTYDGSVAAKLETLKESLLGGVI